ncbi:MAG: heavy metal-binding domain-containing protein [Phycisphaerales bacterium]
MHALFRSFILSAVALSFACVAAPALAQHEHIAERPTPAAAAPVAERYYCPMHCEGEKVYDKAGKCPVCKMTLKVQTSNLYTASVREVSDAGNGTFKAGVPSLLELRIKNPTGMLLKNFETVHEKVLHLLVVSKDLSWFRHEHPVMQPDGTFTLAFAFPAGGAYNVYHDFTPSPAPGAATGPGQQVVRVPVEVRGDVRAPVAIDPDATTPKTIDGYTVTLSGVDAVKSGGSTTLTFTILRDSKPVTTLAPYLGATGHLVVLSENGEEFVHSHPLVGHEGHAMTSGGPTVAFEAHFSTPGLYKAWGQFNVGTKDKEQIVTAPFVFKVEAGEAAHGGHDHK